MSSRDWLILCLFVAGTLLAGGVGSLFTAPAIPAWYATLVRPPLSPPNWIFGPVWTTLYLLMGVAAFLVWRSRPSHRVTSALRIFGFQLALNVLWSVLFFGYRNPQGAFIDIVLLWIAIAATIAAFGRVSRAAAWLLAPYLAWVTFASYLNFAIWMLNP